MKNGVNFQREGSMVVKTDRIFTSIASDRRMDTNYDSSTFMLKIETKFPSLISLRNMKSKATPKGKLNTSGSERLA